MPLIAWLAAVLAEVFASAVIRFLAMKAILITLFVVIMPVVLKYLFVNIVEYLLNWVNAQMAAGQTSHVVELVGLSAWLADRAQLPLVFSMYMSALAVKVTLRMVPFVKVVR